MSNLFSKEAFKNKRIIISGGSGDIGFAVALGFVHAGAAAITLLDKDAEELKICAEKIKSLGCDCIPIEVDLADADKIETAVKSIYAHHPVWDVLVTTAGVVVSGPFTEFDIADWDLMMSVNARAVFVLSRLIAKEMIKQKQGKIVHISSGSTYFGTPGSGSYAASKSVVNQLTQTMAVEWGHHNIQTNAICPTIIETKFLNTLSTNELHTKMRDKLKTKMPFGEFLKTDDIVPAVLFLASEGAKLINGAIIPIDGGSRLVST
ncbi:MAG: SDR family NAD(P)-dependent oxidoreductase [Gammaproteobacteria bacterium]|nr:SDR family NAD(P)-dependent oxidoreductase [Gammaproteobacteria bacterium]